MATSKAQRKRGVRVVVPTPAQIAEMKPAFVSLGLADRVMLPDSSVSGRDVAEIIEAGQRSGQLARLIALRTKAS